jgi:hypothetical protein
MDILKDSGIKEAIQYKGEYHIFDGFDDVVNNIKRYAPPDYTPNYHGKKFLIFIIKKKIF